MGKEQAVIDIGSNTVRLVIFGGPPRAPAVLLNEKASARLGRDLAANGRISQRSRDTALAALARFAVILRGRGITRIETVATAATRDATNGPEFLEKVAALGLNPRQLTGEEEARLSATGVAGAFPDARGIVADLGGGSLELVRLKGENCKRCTTLQLGTLRLPALLTGGQVRFRKRVGKQLADEGWPGKTGETLYLVGGTFRALARYIMHRAALPVDDPHGFEVGPEQALTACRGLARSKGPAPIPGVSASRLAVLPQAAALLHALLLSLKPGRILFSAWGLREGLVFSALPANQKSRDPLLDGVECFTASQGIPHDLTASIEKWIAPIVVHTGLPKSSLVPACISLALASLQVEPNLRAGMLLEWALHKRWLGIGTEQRAAMAVCLAAQGNRKLPAEVMRLASPELLQQFAGMGLAIRLCRRLTGLAIPLIRASSVRFADGNLVLALEPDCAPLVVDAVRRDLALLAGHLGLDPVLEVR